MIFPKHIKPWYLLVLLGGLCCRQTYTPPDIGGNNRYLVVDGIIVNGNDSTIINLSRSQPITDSIYYFMPIPETGARISLTGSGGDTYSLTEQNAGSYTISQL